LGYKIYGKNSALSVELTQTRATGRSKPGAHTLSFEMADFNSVNAAAGANWNQKTTVQVTAKELPQVVAALAGHIKEVEFKFHGPENNKSYKITDRYISTSSPGKQHTVSLYKHDRFEICSLAMKQLQRSHGSLSSDLIYRMLRDCYRGGDESG